MEEHHNNLNQLFDIDNINKVLDAGSGKTSLSYLVKKYPNADIDAIVYPGDIRKIDSIKANVKGKYNLKELDLCTNDIEKVYDLVLAHLLLGEASKFNNNFKKLFHKLMSLNSKYFLLYDFEEDNSVDFDYIREYIKENDFGYVDSDSFVKNEPQQFADFIGKSYQAYLIRRLTLVDFGFMFINDYIDSDKLLEKIKNLKLCLYTEKQQKDILLLIDKLSELINESLTEELRSLISSEKSIKDKIIDVLLNNDTYLELANEMSAKDLLLMITRYICSPRVPNIDQETFDEMVKVGIKYNAKEKIWCLAFSYEHLNKNLDRIVDYFIEIKDSWYLSELVYVVGQDVNIKRLVEKLLKESDKEFVKKFLDSNKNAGEINDKDIELLEKSIVKS